jgi:hypothetical protein
MAECNAFHCLFRQKKVVDPDPGLGSIIVNFLGSKCCKETYLQLPAIYPFFVKWLPATHNFIAFIILSLPRLPTPGEKLQLGKKNVTREI